MARISGALGLRDHDAILVLVLLFLSLPVLFHRRQPACEGSARRQLARRSPPDTAVFCHAASDLDADASATDAFCEDRRARQVRATLNSSSAGVVNRHHRV